MEFRVSAQNVLFGNARKVGIVSGQEGKHLLYY